MAKAKKDKKDMKRKHIEYEQQLIHLKIPGLVPGTVPTKDEAFAFLRERLDRHKGSCDKWAFILHDKDEYTADDENDNPLHKAGTLKEPHIHLYAHFSGNNNYTFEEFAKWFDDSPNRCEEVKRGSSCLEYLTHKNSEGKYQYEPEEVESNFDLIPEILRLKNEEEEANKLVKLVKDYCDGKIQYCYAMDMLEKNMIRSRAWHTAKKDLQDFFDLRRKVNSSRFVQPREIIIFYGESGTGKTTIAEEFAKRLVKSKECYGICFGSANNDIMQNYTDEDILIINDFRTTTSDDSVNYFNNLLRLFDPHSVGSYKSRFSNKTFVGKYIILTTTECPFSFFEGLAGEDKWQLYRRISQLICVGEKELFYYFKELPNGEYCAFEKDRVSNAVISAPLMATTKNPLDDIIKANSERTKKPCDIAALMS